MPDDPALAYSGPESRSIDVLAILFNGDAVSVRGVIANAETSVGEAAQAFGDFGPLAWLGYDGDPAEIEFVQYVEVATGRTLHRRVTKRERTSHNYNTVKIHLSHSATTMPAQRPDFDSRDFGPDFNAR